MAGGTRPGRPATPRIWAVQVLGLVAGYADAAAYLGLGRVFAANMTGNTVLLGVGLFELAGGARLLPQGPARPVLSLVAFAVGTVGAALLVRRFRWSAAYRLGLLLEIGLLVAVAAGWTAVGRRPDLTPSLVLLALASAAMGAQSALANRLAVPGVPTTVVTSSMVTALVGAVAGGRPRAPAVAWAVYLIGAVAGAVGIRMLGAAVLWPPAAVLVLLAATAGESAGTAPAAG